MYFEADRLLPGPDRFPSYMDRIAAYLSRARLDDAAAVLARFLRFEVSPSAFHIVGIDHVALYLGDYRHEDEVESWFRFLADDGRVAGIRIGPSHIAPRNYGTPAYWITGRLAGFDVEMFACRNFGAWAQRARDEVIALMSHHALAVTGPGHVGPLLRYFAHYPGIKELAFEPDDILGHTYGHLIRTETPMVLELVYSPAHASDGE